MCKEKMTCEYCIKGTRISVTNDILCKEKGIVTADYSCPNFMPFPVTELVNSLSFSCADCQYFKFCHNPKIPCYGVCSLFSVRKVDGSKKKICSKFQRKTA